MFDLVVLKIMCVLSAVLAVLMARRILKKDIVKTKTSFKIPGYSLIYSDARPKNKKDNVEYGTLLKSESLDIQGKPDFIFESRFMKRIVPVEIKSGSIKDEEEPHFGDLMQLAAYFVIVEEKKRKKAKYGKLIYKDYMFKVYNTAKLRRELAGVLNDMRSMLNGKMIEAEGSFVKCRHCVCKMTVCEYCEK